MLRDRTRRAPDLGIADKDDDLADIGACTKLHLEPGSIVAPREHGGVQRLHDIGDHLRLTAGVTKHVRRYIAEQMIELVPPSKRHRKQEFFWSGHRRDPTAKGG